MRWNQGTIHNITFNVMYNITIEVYVIMPNITFDEYVYIIMYNITFDVHVTMFDEYGGITRTF